MLNVDNQEKFQSVNDYVSRVSDVLSTVVEAVKKHQMKASGNQKRNFDFKVNFQYYSVGEWVWLNDKTKKRGLSPKLQRIFGGPYEIVEAISEVLYRIQPEGGGVVQIRLSTSIG